MTMDKNSPPCKQPVLFEGDLDGEMQRTYLDSQQLAVDTEARGLKIRRDRLCLVQLCNEWGDTALVRVYGSARAPLLQSVLEAAHVEKILHFARFDMAALQHWLGIRMAPVYCTKIASRLARTYTERHGLKDLVRELCGVEQNKEQQSSDWNADELSPAQISYAIADVAHLVTIQAKLDAMLKSEGRDRLARACMACLPARVDLDLAGWENEDIFAHA
jgi:ribonuclease D